MPGRAYARAASLGFNGGATNIHARLPHQFRLTDKPRSNSARAMGIRRAIQRQCKEKNWKKMILIRHARLTRDTPSASTSAAGAAEQPADKHQTGHPGSDPSVKRPNVVTHEQDGGIDDAVDSQDLSNDIRAKRQQIEDLKARLTTLTAEKHEKFALLKDVLVQEARSKALASVNGMKSRDANSPSMRSPVAPPTASALNAVPAVEHADGSSRKVSAQLTEGSSSTIQPGPETSRPFSNISP